MMLYKISKNWFCVKKYKVQRVFFTLKILFNILYSNLRQCTNNELIYSNTILQLNYIRMNLLLYVYNYIFDGYVDNLKNPTILVFYINVAAQNKGLLELNSVTNTVQSEQCRV